MGDAQLLGIFVNDKAQSHYLSHAVRVLSDCVNQLYLKEEIEAIEQDPNFTAEEKSEKISHLNSFGHLQVLRHYEILICPSKDHLQGGVRYVTTRQARTSEGKLVNRYITVIQYDPNFKEPIKLRLALAHELAHIYLRKIVKKYDETTMIPDPASEEEIEAWVHAVNLISLKDKFYKQDAPELCHCCEAGIWKACIGSVEAYGAKRKLQDTFYDRKNSKSMHICTDCN
ncbi:MAG: hypothetical protein ACRCVN_04390 [Spirochaetia bacterium]